MKYGFIKVAAASPTIKVADILFNTNSILDTIKDADKQGIKLLVFPELSITGYSLGDLIYQDIINDSVQSALLTILKATRKLKMLIFIGMPLRNKDKLYNTAVALCEGKILGVIPKTFLPNYNEFYEKRYFDSAPAENSTINLFNNDYPFGTKFLFSCLSMNNLVVATEICEDLWAMLSPSINHCLAGANIVVNLSASNELVGKAEKRKTLINAHSSRLACGYIYANMPASESSTDFIYSGHNVISENGKTLSESRPFSGQVLTTTELDVNMLNGERIKRAKDYAIPSGYDIIHFDIDNEPTALTRTFKKYPFVPADSNNLKEVCQLIFNMQAHALKKRMEHISAKKIVLGVSGGLDSTLALLIAVHTLKLMNRPMSDILGITMPCYGSTKRTFENSCQLAKAFGIDFEIINIEKAIDEHLKMISHNTKDFDITYENAQARERMQILMDVANKINGIVIGTSDLSELALGFTTYNGDHMSMYSVNAGIPKTLIKHLIRYQADGSNKELSDILLDIISTPISPELIPSASGEIEQKTEDKIGPYMLHDFFIYYMIRMRYSPAKVLHIAKLTFKADYSRLEIEKWLKLFITRFFNNQFKRNCLPDGIKIGSVHFSARSDWRMPSDASASVWLSDLEDADES